MKVLLDTNLLVLLVIGRTDPAAITKHKRSRQFTEDDLGLLDRLLAGFNAVVVTPNIATEASNLLVQSGGLEHEPFLRMLKVLFEAGLIERYVETVRAAALAEYERLGVADCATICEAGAVDHVITADLGLYLALAARGYPVVNFNHVRVL